MMEEAKRVSDSVTRQVQIVSQSSLNGYHRLFGGRLMEWIDIVAAVVARRHSGKNVTTASVDSLIFKKSAYANDTIVLKGFITYVGTTSMEVCVQTFAEHLDGKREEINTAFLVMVAIDEAGQPVAVPKLVCETEEEKRLYESGLKRREYRKLREQNRF